MAINAHYLQVWQCSGAGINSWGLLDVDAELVFFQTGGNVRVGAGIDVRVDPQRDRRRCAAFP
jgi:hypothetical protein